MQRSNWARWLVAGLATLPIGEAGAQVFGFPFAQPAYRRMPRRHAPPAAAASRDVPLPPPRPRFASDPPKMAAPAPAAAVGERAVEPGKGAASTAGAQPEALPSPPASAPPLPPEKPADLASPAATAPAAGTPTAAPQPPIPAVAPSGATNAFTPRQPEVDAGCLDRLKAAKVTFEPVTIGPQPDARCVVMQPVKLSGVTLDDGANVSFPDRPTIACTAAATFAAYVHELLSPLVKGSFGTSLTTVWTGPGLECRSRDNIMGAKLSAHGQGLAVDIAQIRLGDGRTIEVGTPKDPPENAFETAARAGACGYFHTVLGPGSDSYHRTHWHFDLLVRGRAGDSKYCK